MWEKSDSDKLRYLSFHNEYSAKGTRDNSLQHRVCFADILNRGIIKEEDDLKNVPSYHNDAVWPFVQSYYGLALKKAGYIEALKRHKERQSAKGHGFGYEIRDLDGITGAIVCGGMGRERNLITDHREHSMIPTP